MIVESIINNGFPIRPTLFFRKVIERVEFQGEIYLRSFVMKLCDNNDNILMLIEASERDFEGYEPRHEKGCLINRFEYDVRLRDTELWVGFFYSFYSVVKSAFIPCDDNYHICKYNYIWTQSEENNQSLVVEALGLELMDVFDGIRTYVKRIPNNN